MRVRQAAAVCPVVAHGLDRTQSAETQPCAGGAAARGATAGGKNQTEGSGPNGRHLRPTVNPGGSICLILSTSCRSPSAEWPWRLPRAPSQVLSAFKSRPPHLVQTSRLRQFED